MSRRWTDADRDELRRMLVRGDFCQVIARELGRSIAAVRQAARQLKVEARTSTHTTLTDGETT